MKKLIAILLFVALVLGMSACKAPVKDDAVYRTLYSSELTTLNYLLTGNQSDHVVGANCVDTLIEYDNHGNIVPSLATEWKNSTDGTVWTLTLRKGCSWFDYQGNKITDVTANDFVAAAKYALTFDNASACNGPLFDLVNAEAFYNGEITDFAQVGVKAVDDYTIEYTLKAAQPYFLSQLSYVCYMPAYGPQLEELGKDFATANDKMYYCGAYIMSEYEPQVKQVFTKNANNWDADNIFIGTIEKTYNASASDLAPEMVLRGEIDYASLSLSTAEEWLTSNPEYVSRERAAVDYTYFYSFNFDPNFDEKYDPANWKIAVNNASFRKAVMSALDRVYTLSALDPTGAEGMLLNSITPKGFVSFDGKDYTEYGDFDSLKFFDEAAAKDYKTQAIADVTADGGSFPVKMYVTYNPNTSNWDNECVLLEQKLESVLGTDFIDVMVVAGPSEGFLGATRRAGNYAFLKTNWGADYLDPLTFTEPFWGLEQKSSGNNYQFMFKVLDDTDPVTDETKTTVTEYYRLLELAMAEKVDIAKRYELFADAEQYLIENAMVIPYAISTVEYQATRLNVYEGQFASFGISTLRYKGQHVLDDFVSMEELAAAKAAYDAK